MIVVAGITLKNLTPKVWEETSVDHLPQLAAVMISYADFHRSAPARKRAMNVGLRSFLGLPAGVKAYLDNGSFYFLTRPGAFAAQDYEEFVREAQPDWYPIPQDIIPSPRMSLEEQRTCLRMTMTVNLRFLHDGFVPVMHISQVINEYVQEFKIEPRLLEKSTIGLGGIVPNLLRMPKD